MKDDAGRDQGKRGKGFEVTAEDCNLEVVSEYCKMRLALSSVLLTEKERTVLQGC